MPLIRPQPSYPRDWHQRWYGCVTCGGQWTEDSDAVGVDEQVGWGMLYREADTVIGEDGQRRCVWHHRAKYYIKAIHDAEVDFDENERGDEVKFTD